MFGKKKFLDGKGQKQTSQIPKCTKVSFNKTALKEITTYFNVNPPVLFKEELNSELVRVPQDAIKISNKEF